MTKEKDLRTGKKQARIRDKNGRFVKGKSGNPGGRKRQSTEFKAACEELTISALNVLKEIMLDPAQPAAARIKAAEVIIDRAYGKAPQALEIDQADAAITISIEGYDGYGD